MPTRPQQKPPKDDPSRNSAKRAELRAELESEGIKAHPVEGQKRAWVAEKIR